VGRRGLTVLALVLLVGSAAAFTRTERLKLAPSPVAKPKFERHLAPECGCRHATALLSLLFRRPEKVDVSVVDADGGHVATLVRGRDERGGRRSFRWDAKDDEGRVVSDGLYRLRIRLVKDRRTILIPTTIHVDTLPPRVEVLSVTAAAGVTVRYRTSEAAKVLLEVDGKVVERGEFERRGAHTLTWAGPFMTPGAHQVSLVGIDRAGNGSEPTVPVSVESP
jgi:hypothetical protein